MELSLNRRRIILWLGLVPVAAVAVGVLLSGWLHLRRHARAIEAFDAATAAYMMYDVAKAKALFDQVARDYEELPVGALAELKVAFLVYDEAGDLDEAERLFVRFLETHRETVLHLPQTPQQFEYHGELELVAWHFLGRIAKDRGRPDEAHRWFQRIVETGSRNPANYIVSEARATVARARRAEERP